MSLVGFSASNHPQQVRKVGADGDVDDRWTPPETFDPLHAEHGFTLDVAASSANAKVPRYFDMAADGLGKSWAGERVWCNPPYSDLGAWVTKAWAAMLEEGADRVVMLIPANRTEQKWWQASVEPYRDGESRFGVSLSVRFLPGRLRFHRPGWQAPPSGNRPPFGCCILTWLRTAA